jgi:hypothetical protein
MSKTWITGSLGVLALAIAVMAIGGCESAPPEPESVEGMPPIASMTADKLYQEYQANGVAADSKYSGQVVEVTGVVAAIGKDLLNNMTVTLKAGSDELTAGGTGILCYCPESQKDKLAKLSQGKSIKVKGLYSGMKVSFIWLRKCVVEEPSAPAAPTPPNAPAAPTAPK